MQLMRWLAVRGALSDLYKDDLLAEAGILAWWIMDGLPLSSPSPAPWALRVQEWQPGAFARAAW